MGIGQIAWISIYASSAQLQGSTGRHAWQAVFTLKQRGDSFGNYASSFVAKFAESTTVNDAPPPWVLMMVGRKSILGYFRSDPHNCLLCGIDRTLRGGHASTTLHRIPGRWRVRCRCLCWHSNSVSSCRILGPQQRYGHRGTIIQVRDIHYETKQRIH